MERESRHIGCQPPYKVVCCIKCGLTFLHPQPDVAKLKATYGESYFRLYKELGILFPGGEDVVPDYLIDRLARIEAITGKGKILEIGCAEGVFLSYAKQMGWQVQGVDISDWATRAASKKFGIEVFCGIVEEAGFPAEFFDVVHMNHVLEHLPNPLETLLEIRRILRKTGILAVEVPNEFGNLFQWFRRKILRRLPHPYEVPSSHLFFFTPAILCRILERTGFSLMELRTPRRNKDLDSRIPGGRIAKKLIYRVEEVFKKGPLIEVLVRKRGSCSL